MNDENRNLILAVILSAAVLFGWEYFVAKPQMEQARATHALTAQHAVTAPSAPSLSALPRTQALSQGPRIAIDTPSLDGSLSLRGARFDDLRLKNYRETVDPKSPEIVLFSPEKTQYPYFAMIGWLAQPGSSVKVPDDTTVWTATPGARLTPSSPVTLSWNNGQGLVFTRTITVDTHYLFTVHDTVANGGHARVTLYPYAFVMRDGVPQGTHFWALHEGFVGVANGTLKDANYTDFKNDEPPQAFQSTGGWFAITDKYWMAAVIAPPTTALDGAFEASPLGSTKAYQANYRLGAVSLAPGAITTISQRLFAGAKDDRLLEQYESHAGIEKFHLAIDWGWFWFFTQPIFKALDWFAQYMNMGLAILLLTVLIKLAFFPLADASYRSMSKMKKLQPEMERIKALYADDQAKQQQEIMDLYRREKINPVSGCLPMLIQIPVFFSLYKVLLGTIEMRQAPFFGWIHDLSAPDPTSIINLFGLLPFNPHLLLPTYLAFLSVGIWPILMGMTQWLQTKLNPPATDPVQQQMFTYMPLIFTFMLAGLPSGLVIYWTWNNLLSVGQQYVMMRRQGVEIHLFKNMKLPALGQPRTDPRSD